MNGGFAAGARDASASVEACLAAIELWEPEIHALVEEPGRAARLRAEADALGRAAADPESRPSGGPDRRRPLHGLVVGVKDLFRVDGFATRAGSALPAELFAGAEASSVTRLRGAGAWIAGKTCTDEFAYSEPPPTRNPYDLERTPGGSSAGSAAGVAVGMFPAALGTQTSRSIVAPAAFCGVVGFKPSHGRVPIDGVVALSPFLDTVGVLARDIDTADQVASVLLDGWRTAPGSAGAPVLGVPDGAYLDRLPVKDWREPFEAAIEALAAASARVVRRALPWDEVLDGLAREAMTVLHGEMARVHEAWFGSHGDLYRPRTREGIDHGRKVGDADIEAARESGLRLRASFEDWFAAAGVDLFASPSQPGRAPALGTRTGWGNTTTPWSFAGLPCVSLPAGLVQGLPSGLQLIGRYGRDEDLLAFARWIEQSRALKPTPPPSLPPRPKADRRE